MDDAVMELYQSSFSETEKIPYDNIIRVLSRGALLYTYHDQGSFVGFTFSFADGDRMFLIYFATVPKLRGMGYGSRILSALREMHPDKRIFLVLEPSDPGAADSELRSRRHGFYERNGCIDTGVRILSDDEWFDSMFVQGRLSEEEMVGTVNLYEDIHNGRV
jgi:GNAT superfamily N-acetyltransferase